MKIIIPMAGQGSRFSRVGYQEPKPLIPVDGKPMIEHVVGLFDHPTMESQWDSELEFVFICNNEHLEKTNMKQVLLKLKPNCRIISVKPNKKGPVYTVTDALPEIFQDEDDLEEEVIISYCDYGTSWDFPRFLSEIYNPVYEKDWEISGSVACYRGFHPHMLGKDNYAFVREKDGDILEIQEKKPFTEDRMSEYASNGTYYFRKGEYVVDYFPRLIERKIEVNGEYYISLIYNLMIEDGLRISVFEIDQMLQWGTPYDLSVYQMWSNYFKRLLLEEDKEGFTCKHPDGTTLVLPLAGRGNRFAVQGYDVPKPLLLVEGEPMVIQAALSVPPCDSYTFICLEDHVYSYSIDEVLKIRFGQEKTTVMSIREVTQGQACTCELRIKDLDGGKPVCITACDNGVVYDARKYQKLLDDPSVDVIVWSFRNNPTSMNNPNMYAWLDVDEADNIRNVSVKKCNFDEPLKHHAIIGTMFFRRANDYMDGLQIIYEMNIRTNGEFYVDDLLNPLIQKGLKVKVFESDFYVCWGTPDDYRTYQYWSRYFHQKYQI